MRYFKKLEGNLCYLSPINPEDYEKYTEWLNDLEVAVNLTLATKMISLPDNLHGYYFSRIQKKLTGFIINFSVPINQKVIPESTPK